MAIVTFRLTDFGFNSIQGLEPVVEFVPQFAVGSVAIQGERLLPSKPIEATLVGSEGPVNLVPNVGTVPETWYEVRIKYLDAAGAYVYYDVYGLKVWVPSEGGALPDLPGYAPSADRVLVSLAPPPPGYKGWYLNAPGAGNPPGNPDDPASSGTGILEIVS